MTINSNKNKFWDIIGKISVSIGLIVLGIQIYDYCFKNDYNIIAKGSYFTFGNPPDVKDILIDYSNIKNTVKAYQKCGDGKKNDSLEQLDLTDRIRYILNNKSTIYKNCTINRTTSYYDYDDKIFTNSVFLYDKYKSYWQFTIKNDGNKPLEELILDLPFDGVYELFSKNAEIVRDKFTNTIVIGMLKPTYEVNINVWTKNEISRYSNYDEDKSRITHKYGSQSIQFSTHTYGLLAWIEKNYFSDFIITIILIILLLLLLGHKYVPIIIENEKKLKLKEMEKLLKLMEEKNKKAPTTPPNNPPKPS